VDVCILTYLADIDRLAHQRITRAGQGIEFKHKDKRMLWRGATTVGPVIPERVQLLDVTRGHDDVADVSEVVWTNGDKPVNFMSPSEMCSWKYLLYTEGTLFSINSY
jgi:hypothetical protein